jgi:rhodanese-related sulfurtransferase
MIEVVPIFRGELEQRLLRGGEFQFWNVLTDEFFHNEMIPGSRRVPLDTLEREVATGSIPKDVGVVVYCAGPSCPQSRQAAEKLASLGFTNVRFYEGGLEEWKKSGGRIETVKPAAA